MVVSFDRMIELLKEYKNNYGNLLIPEKYVNSDGTRLGNIVCDIRRGDRKLTVEEKTKLNELGFVWKCYKVLSFVEILELLKEYKKEHGNLLVPRKYCTASGINLGNVVQSIRTGNRKITVEEKVKLDDIGFVWKVQQKITFTMLIELLEEYKNNHGNLLVPGKYCTVDGIRLGMLVKYIRVGRKKTTVKEKKKLNELGFVWKIKEQISFAEVVELLVEYKNKHGDLLVPTKYCTVDGIKLGSIVSNIRAGARKTTAEEKAKLDEIGFVWKVR